MLKRYHILLLIILFPVLLFAQTEQIKRGWQKNWRLGTMGGISFLAAELKKDYSRATIDMNSNPQGSFNFYLNKRFNNNLEAGIEFEKNYFSGDKKYPGNINWLVYDSYFNNANSTFLLKPVYYKTNTSSWFINLNYNFLNIGHLNNSPQNINMYLKGGIGISSIGLELGYSDPLDYELSNLPNPLFVKGQGTHPAKDNYLTYHVGTGLNYYLSPRISISTEFMFLFVSVDYLDGVKNFDATKLPNDHTVISRVGVLGAVGELKVGISYHFNWYRKLLNEGLWENKFDEFQNDFYHEKELTRPSSKELPKYPKKTSLASESVTILQETAKEPTNK